MKSPHVFWDSYLFLIGRYICTSIGTSQTNIYKKRIKHKSSIFSKIGNKLVTILLCVFIRTKIKVDFTKLISRYTKLGIDLSQGCTTWFFLVEQAAERKALLKGEEAHTKAAGAILIWSITTSFIHLSLSPPPRFIAAARGLRLIGT